MDLTRTERSYLQYLKRVSKANKLTLAHRVDIIRLNRKLKEKSKYKIIYNFLAEETQEEFIDYFTNLDEAEDRAYTLADKGWYEIYRWTDNKYWSRLK